MNSGPFSGDWLRLVLVLGIELGLIALVFCLLQRPRHSAIWRRLLWRAALVGSVVVVLGEISGGAQWMSGWAARGKDKPHVVTIVSANLPPSPELNAVGQLIEEPNFHPPIAAARAEVEVANTPVVAWWPAWIWLGGTLFLIARMALAHLVFAIGLRRRGRLCESQTAARVAALAALLGMKRRVPVFEMEDLPAPVSYGAFFSGIVLPSHFTRENDESSQDAMLIHELAHVNARDGFWHGVGDIVAACLWWHPVIWWMRREMAAASELAADEASVVVDNGPRALAGCLVAMARKLAAPAGLGWQGIQGSRFRSRVGRRVERLLGLEGVVLPRTGFARRWAGRIFVAMLLGGMLLLGAMVGHRPGPGAGALSWRESWNASMGRMLLSQVAAAEPEPVDRIAWLPWSSTAVTEARAQGRPVLVYFTADWALDALANEGVALEVSEVRERLRSLNAAALKADWTKPNTAIEEELNRFGRMSVPLTLVYSPDAALAPEVLPNVLTSEIVLAALDRAIAGRSPSTKVAMTNALSAASSSVPQVSTILFEGKALYDSGKTAEAKAKFAAVLKDDPKNEAARHYLSLIDKAPSPPGAVTAPLDDIDLNTAFITQSPGFVVTNPLAPPFPPPRPIKPINEKLDSIKLSTFGGIMTLSATVRKLHEEARSADPDKVGINVFVNDLNKGGYLHRSGDFSQPAVRIEPQLVWRDLESVEVRLDRPLHDVTLREALDAIVKTASDLIQYEVRQYAVVISFQVRPSADSLRSRLNVGTNVTLRTNTALSKELSQGRALYEAGSLAEAKDKFTIILKEDPKNEAARHYLALIEKAQTHSTPLPATSSKRASLYTRLDAILLDSFGGTMSLTAFVQKLGAEVRAADPSSGGINFLITGRKGQLEDLSAIMVQIEPPLRGASVRQILNAMVKGAGELILYTVEDYGVVITQAPPVPSAIPPPDMHTRWFKVDPKSIMTALKERIGASAEKGTLSDAIISIGKRPRNEGVTVATTSDEVIIATRLVFATAGLDFTQPGRQLFFNDRLGMLMVRATLPELDRIEQTLQTLLTPPPQVTIEARFCEVSEEAWAALGLGWMLQTMPSGLVAAPGTATNDVNFGLPSPAQDPALAVTGTLTDRQAKVVLRALSERRGVNVLTTPKVTTLSGRQAQIKTVEVRSVVTHLVPVDPPRSTGPGRGGGGVDDVVPVTEPFESGPMLDVIPYVQPDGYTIAVRLIATVKEFVGYDLETPATRIDNSAVGAPNPVYQGVTLPPIIGPELSRDRSQVVSARPVAQTEPRPVYRLRQMTAPVRVWDGQTIVLAGGVDKLDHVRSKSAPVLSDLPIIGKAFRTQHAEKQKNKLVVLVTVRIIDPAGNAVHDPDAARPAPSENLK